MYKQALFICLLFCLWAAECCAQSSTLHPMNRQLMDLGLMDYPKYFPEIPRITATAALHYYNEGKAKLVLISYSNKHQIVGGMHFTEDVPPNIDPNSIPLLPGQVLITY